MKKLLSLMFAFALSFNLVACGTDAEEPAVDEPVVEDDMEEKEVVLNWNIGADPKTLDPGLNGASDGGDVINNTFESLVREVNGEILPGMADSWEVSEDGLTVTFNIRDNAMWSDGSKITAEDFVFSWKRGMDPRTASEYSWLWHYTNVVGANPVVDSDPQGEAESDEDYAARIDALLAEVGIAADGNKFVVTLTQPTNWFVSLTSFYHFIPVPKDIVSDPDKAGEDGFWAKTPEYAISNGPFKLVEYKVGSGLKLVKNENYWNADAVGIDVIDAKFIDDANTAYSQFEAGELDVLPSVPVSETQRLIAESPEFHVFPLLGTYYINFNLNPDVDGFSDPMWNNAKLRKALAFSIDRELITETLGAGQVPAGGFVPKGFADHNGDDFFTKAGMYGFSTDDSNYGEAVTLFEEAAAELGMSVDELRTALEGKTYLYNTSEGHKKVAELVQEMWKTNLGFTVQLGNEEWAVFQVTRTDGRFDMARGGWITDFMDPSGLLGIFTPDNAYNDAGYDNADFNALMEEARVATDAASHFEALYDAQAVLMGDVPIIPIYHYSDTLLVRSNVSGWGRSVLGAIDFSSATVTE
jgi:oligopeptide transport system substrate-binding protein